MSNTLIKPDAPWKLELFHLLLTLDILEEFLNSHSLQSFANSPDAIGLIGANLIEIAGMAKNIPAAVRLQCPDIPWAFLRHLDTFLTIDCMINKPAVTWSLLHRRVLVAKRSLRVIVEEKYPSSSIGA